MRILMTAGIFPPKVGGPATYVPRVAGALLDRGHEVEIITPGPPADETFDYPVHRTASSIPWRILDSIRQIKARVEWADCIFDNALSPDVYLSSLFHNTPVLQKIVGDRSWERYRNNRKGTETIDAFQSTSVPITTEIRRRFQHRISQSMDRILVPSQYLKSIVKQWGVPEHRIRVIYNSAHKPADIPDTPELEWPGNGLNLLAVGRLVPWKRVPQLIRHVAELQQAGLVILGNGPDYDKCKKTIDETDSHDQIQLKGNVPGKQVWAHLKVGDVLLLNSTYEGFPHIVLEAMASGIPVIGAASGGTKEAAEFFPEHVYLYDLDQPERMQRLLRNNPPQRFDPMGFPSGLQWNQIMDQTEQLLEEIAHDHE